VRRARSNLARASQGQFSPDVLLEDVCFDAQQAVEKALKALLVSRGVRVPRTHAIGELITVLAAMGFDVPADVQDGAALTDYAVAARYPGPSEPVSVEDYDRALATARAVVAWVEGLVSERSEPESSAGSTPSTKA
jgi:HEPN domain-containing protein